MDYSALLEGTYPFAGMCLPSREESVRWKEFLPYIVGL
jgi:hypothetical protein